MIKPIWEQFSALLPKRDVGHPLGCHRARIPDRLVFEKLVQVLVFGCAYEKIADEGCSATTLRRCRDEWIGAGVVDALREVALEAYDRIIGPELSDVAVDCCITKAPCGGEDFWRFARAHLGCYFPNLWHPGPVQPTRACPGARDARVTAGLR
ncbi:MAG: hypothetical protein M3Q60_12745, partial [Actinomycetota bacterium]|nr:hypothetical protein [Actinomycetota bacterium]